MEPELPSSPILDRWFAEAPWTVAFPLVVAAAVLAWWGARNDRVRPIMAGVGCLLAAAGTAHAQTLNDLYPELATLIAAERTGRRFRGLDIDPLYVDLVVERWRNLTGGRPRLKRVARAA